MTQAKRYLDLAARLALRAAGDVEPNPMVGCVIVRSGQVIGLGHHRRFGGPHAEREAIADCRRRGHDPRGADLYVTLEPCNHHGKTPPCTEAILEAGIARVIAARPDPNPISTGGAERLASAGIPVKFTQESASAEHLSDPFIRVMTTGLPWVITKWAQTIDGRIATRDGASKWISGPAARVRVHRLRARVDAIVTGIGTVLADDPLLTARDVRRVRRIARRVVVDGRLEIPPACALVRTAREVPLLIACDRAALARSPGPRHALESAGAEIVGFDAPDGRIDLHALLRDLASRHKATNILFESGATLLGSLFEQDLVDEAIVHVAPTVLGDDRALAAVAGRAAPRLADGRRLTFVRSHAVGPDLELVYVRPTERQG